LVFFRILVGDVATDVPLAKTLYRNRKKVIILVSVDVYGL